MDELYASYATNLIIGTVFVCVVIVPLFIYAAIHYTREAPPALRFALRFFVVISAIFGVVSSVYLISALLGW